MEEADGSHRQYRVFRGCCCAGARHQAMHVARVASAGSLGQERVALKGHLNRERHEAREVHKRIRGSSGTAEEEMGDRGETLRHTETQ